VYWTCLPFQENLSLCRYTSPTPSPTQFLNKPPRCQASPLISAVSLAIFPLS
jgi:hypothetical protein